MHGHGVKSLNLKYNSDLLPLELNEEADTDQFRPFSTCFALWAGVGRITVRR